MEYHNQDLVDYVDQVANQILAGKANDKYRDHFFPELINAMNLNIGVEVGVDTGKFTEHLLAKTNMNMVYGIDPWIDNFGSDFRPEYFDVNGNARYNEAATRLLNYIPERCTLVQGFSVEAAQTFEDNSIDFCYIDGDHSLEGIFNDLYTWIHKVRTGGIISGHDYKDGPNSGMPDFAGNQLDYKIKTVVDNFCQQYGFKLNTVGGRILNWWFVKNA